jgi:hypothetical protein
MAISVLAQELILGSLQAIRLHQEFAARAADGKKSDDELRALWADLEARQKETADLIAAKKAELQAQGE